MSSARLPGKKRPVSVALTSQPNLSYQSATIRPRSLLPSVARQAIAAVVGGQEQWQTEEDRLEDHLADHLAGHGAIACRQEERDDERPSPRPLLTRWTDAVQPQCGLRKAIIAQGSFVYAFGLFGWLEWIYAMRR
jgi:hypothetical protein